VISTVHVAVRFRSAAPQVPAASQRQLHPQQACRLLQALLVRLFLLACLQLVCLQLECLQLLMCLQLLQLAAAA
jgi:hypothetical protein